MVIRSTSSFVRVGSLGVDRVMGGVCLLITCFFFFPLGRAEDVDGAALCPGLHWALLEAVAVLGPACEMEEVAWVFVTPLSVRDILCQDLPLLLGPMLCLLVYVNGCLQCTLRHAHNSTSLKWAKNDTRKQYDHRDTGVQAISDSEQNHRPWFRISDPRQCGAASVTLVQQRGVRQEKRVQQCTRCKQNSQRLFVPWRWRSCC